MKYRILEVIIAIILYFLFNIINIIIENGIELIKMVGG